MDYLERNEEQIEIKEYCYHLVQNLLSFSLLSSNIKINTHRNITLPVVLHGCETWSLTSREERRLRVSENRVLRRLLGPKRDEVPREWGKLHNEELNDLYSTPSIVQVLKSRRMRWVGLVACMGKRISVYKVLVENPEGKNHLEDPGVGGRIILRWIFKNWDVGYGLDCSGSG